MKYSVLVLLISVLVYSGAFAQPTDEPVEDTGDETVIDADVEETPPDSAEVVEEIPADSTAITEDIPQEDVEEETGTDSDYSFYVEVVLPDDPDIVLQTFFEALRTGDSVSAGFLISEEGLESIDLILDILKENLDSNEESTMNRLTAAGYVATADEIEDWGALEYFQATVILPVMKSRYFIYEMQVGEFELNNDEIDVPLLFVTASGLELPFQSQLVQDDDGFWKVTSFMGLSSFP